MTRRGRCRCGKILKFRKGPLGYKTRCAACNSVVRLRVRNAGTAPARLGPPPLPPGLGLPSGPPGGGETTPRELRPVTSADPDLPFIDMEACPAPPAPPETDR